MGLIALVLLAGNGVAHAAAQGNLWLVGDSITSGFTVAGPIVRACTPT